MPKEPSSPIDYVEALWDELRELLRQLLFPQDFLYLIDNISNAIRIHSVRQSSSLIVEDSKWIDISYLIKSTISIFTSLNSVALGKRIEFIYFIITERTEGFEITSACFVPKTLMLNPSALIVQYKVEQGSKGGVYVCEYLKNRVIVKVMKVWHYAEEIELHVQFNHPHKVGLLGVICDKCINDGNVYDDPTSILLLLEYCKGGNLTSWLRSSSNYTFQKAHRIAVEIANVMAFLHARSITHNDIKTDVIFLDKDLSVKIGGFGYCTALKGIGNNPTAYRKGGTLQFTAPEVLGNGIVGYSSDVYSFGIILYELFVSRCWWTIESEILNYNCEEFNLACAKDFIDAIKSDVRPSLPPIDEENPHKEVLEGVYAVMVDCLKGSPDERPTFEKIVQRLDPLKVYFSDACICLERIATGADGLTIQRMMDENKSDDYKLYRGKYDGKPVVAQQMSCSSTSHWELAKRMEELQIRWGLVHPNIVVLRRIVKGKVTDTFDNNNHNYEIATSRSIRKGLILLSDPWKMTLSNWIKRSAESKFFSYADRLDFAMQMAKGIKFIHSKNILHMRLSFHTTYIYDNLTLKVGHFSKAVQGIRDELGNLVKVSPPDGLHPYYRTAPEWFVEGCVYSATEVFVFGFFLHVLFVSNNEDATDQAALVVRNSRNRDDLEKMLPNKVEGQVQKEIVSLIRECWKEEKTQRPSFDMIAERLKALRQVELQKRHNALLVLLSLGLTLPCVVASLSFMWYVVN